MSLSIEVRVYCDNCGFELSDPFTEHRAGKIKSLIRSLRLALDRQGWISVKRGPGHTTADYCPDCVDKPIKPIARKQEDTK